MVGSLAGGDADGHRIKGFGLWVGGWDRNESQLRAIKAIDRWSYPTLAGKTKTQRGWGTQF